MTSNNEKTLKSYEAENEAYLEKTTQSVTGSFKAFLDATLQGLKKEARILEIGSGFGRDALYMQEKGFVVEATDAVPAFVEQLKAKGLNATPLDLLKDEIEGPYDLIFANAVLLHFTRDEIKTALRKIRNALRTGGRFAFSLKKGEGEAWSTEKLGAPRYFCYWQEDQLDGVLYDAGFSTKRGSSDAGEKGDQKWIRLIAEANA